jgi:demethylmenaquinone methyltransferase/2-methoxy-6-polyprenyl-1,4-benzoquinol methylase
LSIESGPLPSPERKVAYVRDMFRRIAGRYDLMNRVMTFGRDKSWRRITVSRLGLARGHTRSNGKAMPPMVLDVASGTGDLAFETLRQSPEAQVIGLDLVPEMLLLAQRKRATPGWPLFLAGDALRIPFVDSTFDGVVTGFALRNVTDIPAAFTEMARVTRPGGRVACLEIAKPRTPVFRHFFAFYFYRVVPMVGRWITGDPQAYTYLPHSLTAFLTPDEIVDVMRRTGWRDVSYKRLMLGTVAIHVGTRT